MPVNSFLDRGHYGRCLALHWCCLPHHKSQRRLHKNGLFRTSCRTGPLAGLAIMHTVYIFGTGRYSFFTWHCGIAKQWVFVAVPLFLLSQFYWPCCCTNLLRNHLTYSAYTNTV